MLLYNILTDNYVEVRSLPCLCEYLHKAEYKIIFA